MTLEEFLVKCPPGTVESITIKTYLEPNYGTQRYIKLETIELHCNRCKGIRFFSVNGQYPLLAIETTINHFCVFSCNNCKDYNKIYALTISLVSDEDAVVIKVGEWPFFGPPISKYEETLVDKQKEYYMKGRRAENQGMGIGAFAYYRRVVENQKTQIIDKIIEVAENSHASKEMIGDLKKARKEIQFTKAVDAIKHGIPESLMVQSYNPLQLLHKALSGGIHNEMDEECLKEAGIIRTVLAALAERLTTALKVDGEFSKAVSKLATSKKTKP